MISKEKIAAFQKHILDWYRENKRDLPWREIPFDVSLGERDPYKILISEVMSQQTQLSRVVPKYEVWLKKFPTVQSLANAKVADLLHYWNGLGYNRRALNLQKLAQKIITDYNGIFPRDEKELLALPGVGPYTARAILCFAFEQQIAVLDTNVRKVILTQLLNPENSIIQSLSLSDSKSILVNKSYFIGDKMLHEIARQLLPHGKAYEWNQALMDYAAAVLKKEKIPVPKQSKFHGSHRYYRGQVVKALLTQKKIEVKELGLMIKSDYSNSEEEWLRKLIDELIREGFVIVENSFIKLA